MCQTLHGADLSITHIAGLPWSEWNARLATMPLVTQLHEGTRPLTLPTDLSLDKNLKKCSVQLLADFLKSERKSPLKRSNSTSSLVTLGVATTTVANDMLHEENSCSPTPLNCSNVSDNATDMQHPDKSDSSTNSNPGNGALSLKHLSDNEARALMLKVAVEKSSANTTSGNVSDTGYSEDNTNTGGNLSGSVVAASDYHSAFAAEVSGAAELCKINLLNSINVMSNLIVSGSGGTTVTSTGTNGSLNVGGSAVSGGLSSVNAGTVTGSGAGHPCPECGRQYKLKSSLRNHQKWECGKEPQFQCPFCVYRAKQKMHIGRHMERMHKEKFYKIEDLKSFTMVGVGGGGGTSSGGSLVSTAAAADVGIHSNDDTSSSAVSELRANFS